LQEYGVDGGLLLAVKPLCSCSVVCVSVGGVKSQPLAWVLESGNGERCHH